MTTITLHVVNTLAKGSVKLIKKDTNTEELLAGAVFSLFQYNDKTKAYDEIDTGLTTDGKGELTIEGLLPGKYKLLETQAPSDHYIEDEQEALFEIKLDEEGKIIPLSDITMTNLPFIELRIIKVDGNNEETVLPGAEFRLVRILPDVVRDGNIKGVREEIVEEHLVSDEHGRCTVCNLKRGEYKLIETKAPYGYLLPEDPETIVNVE